MERPILKPGGILDQAMTNFCLLQFLNVSPAVYEDVLTSVQDGSLILSLVQLNLTLLDFSRYESISTLAAWLYELVGPMLSMSNTSQNTLSQLPLQITVYFDNRVSNLSYLKQKQHLESKKHPFINRNIQVKVRTTEKTPERKKKTTQENNKLR